MLGLWPDKTRHTIYSPCDGMLDAGAGARLSFTAIALGLFPGVQGIRLCLKDGSVAAYLLGFRSHRSQALAVTALVPTERKCALEGMAAALALVHRPHLPCDADARQGRTCG